ncbi:MAG: hypothetical protein ACPGJE_09955, partial [Wenzhouxiangellaceae bacterium]
PNLSERIQAWLYNEAAFRLRALGRLTEALGPMRAGLEKDIQREDWKNAAIGASNLSNLEATLGDLDPAVNDARRAVDFADRIEPQNLFQRMTKRTAAADALHQRDQRDEARRLFERAEELQRELQPQFEWLYSLQGFLYCDLNLAPAERAAWRYFADVGQQKGGPAWPTGSERGASSHSLPEVELALGEAERRGNKMFEQRVPGEPLLGIALDHLTLARVELYRAMLDPRSIASFSLDFAATALDAMRKANQLDYLPRALLTAAASQHLAGNPDKAEALLTEAQHIAERGPMPLHLADVHLHRARLFRDRDELAKAKALIKKHGYWRRREELADAEEASGNW